VIEGSDKLARCFQHETDTSTGCCSSTGSTRDPQGRTAGDPAGRLGERRRRERQRRPRRGRGRAIKVSPHPTFGQAR